MTRFWYVNPDFGILSVFPVSVKSRLLDYPPSPFRFSTLCLSVCLSVCLCLSLSLSLSLSLTPCLSLPLPLSPFLLFSRSLSRSLPLLVYLFLPLPLSPPSPPSLCLCLSGGFEDVTLTGLILHPVTCVPGDSYRTRFRSLL